MASKTEIANMALTHIAVGKTIADLDNEQSQEANVIRLHYDVQRQELLEDFNWPFAKVATELGLVEENPTSEWAYSYRYPSEALKLIRIPSGIRNDNRQSRVPYKVYQDDTAKLIYTDKEDACMEYIKDETDVNKFDANFKAALSYRIAAVIAPFLTSGDSDNLSTRMLRFAELKVQKAAAKAFNEEQDDEEPESEFIRARD